MGPQLLPRGRFAASRGSAVLAIFLVALRTLQGGRGSPSLKDESTLAQSSAEAREVPSKVTGPPLLHVALKSPKPHAVHLDAMEHEHTGGHGHFAASLHHLVSHPRVFVAEIAVVVLLSTLFETWEHSVRHRFSHGDGDQTAGKILDAVFKEITCLGFIGLVLFLFVRCGAADLLAPKIFPAAELQAENPLFETVETVHMILFLLLLVLLLQAAAMLRVSYQVISSWSDYEHKKSFGMQDSFEALFVREGYLERVPNPKAPRGLDLVCRKPFTYGDTFLERLVRRQGPLHKVVMWRVLRYEFLFPHDECSRRIPDPSLFRFEAYLQGRLGKTLLSLIELDMSTWFCTLLFMVPLMYACITLPFTKLLETQCILSWLLLAFAVVLTLMLEEDIYQLTPQLPADARRILRMFAGTSLRTMRRQLNPSKSAKEREIIVGAPGLSGVEDEPASYDPIPAPAFQVDSDEPTPMLLSLDKYEQVIRIFFFWQAIAVTSSIITLLSGTVQSWTDIGLHVLTWVEWPLMLFWVTPVLLGRVTMLNSIEGEKDDDLIRRVAFSSKEAVLRFYLRLVELVDYYGRAQILRDHDSWWIAPTSPTIRSAIRCAELFRRGLRKFDRLPHVDREEVWEIFAMFDINNDMSIHSSELQDAFKSMGFEEFPEAAESLVRLVDHDGTGALSWDKFKSLVGEITVDRPADELHEGLEVFFDIIDKDKNNMITVEEFTEWVQRIKSGMVEQDVASLLYRHFGLPKRQVTKIEFIEWIQAVGHLSPAKPPTLLISRSASRRNITSHVPRHSIRSWRPTPIEVH